MRRIDLNCDLGEGAPHDAALMPIVTSANVACGIHAGDVDTMRATIQLALTHGVAVGAHPSLNDRPNFGRRELPVTASEVHLFVLTQTRLLQIIAKQCGARVVHVKPHGALYTMAARDVALARAVAQAVQDADPGLILFGLSGSRLIEAGRTRGLRVASEVFADRTYQAGGVLTPRAEAGAVIGDVEIAAAQVARMVRESRVRAVDGSDVRIEADTVCLHGDGPAPVEFAARIRRELLQTGAVLRAPGG